MAAMHYRADQLGSLLRPAELLEGRTAYAAGRMSSPAHGARVVVSEEARAGTMQGYRSKRGLFGKPSLPAWHHREILSHDGRFVARHCCDHWKRTSGTGCGRYSLHSTGCSWVRRVR